MMNHPQVGRGAASLADERHGPAAVRTHHDGRLGRVCGWGFGRSRRTELGANGGEGFACPGMEEAEVTQSMKTAVQDVLQVAVDKLGAVDSDLFGSCASAIPDADGHGIFIHGEDARVAYRPLMQVGTEVFDGMGAVAKVGHVAVELDGPERF